MTLDALMLRGLGDLSQRLQAIPDMAARAALLDRFADAICLFFCTMTGYGAGFGSLGSLGSLGRRVAA